MGRQVTYVRRKQDAECYNGEEFERQILNVHCPCEEIDYECDTGYIRTSDGKCSQLEE